ncbi:HAMP domain-containing histidine kinase [Blautia glucerasea]|uniref:sensor histidine kinase n=1 Tax=Blautia glucerasea TaxID=536633 RepID=UPI001D021979|nr:HAMP domain-containing sensor histidine kinase [Blautia glucerasea]MCB5388598.1 HAMP domain-containing histidine kinase [Blautia glucerasea]MCB5422933.1 HAMP domain-containing histidine kinase [Blautia luti]
MFKKLHRQMTLFSTLITSGILILMAAASLAIFERGLVRNSYERFLNNGNSCVAYLENQTILSHKWILEAKLEYGVEFRILNNGKRMYFDKLNEESSGGAAALTGNARENSVESMLAEAAWISKEEQGLDVEYAGSISIPKEVYFETSDFYACTALIPKGNGVLSLVLVYPLEGLKAQIFQQRVLFGGMVLLAVLALGVFSWLFTGKMLRPLEENRKKQTQFIASASHELRSPLAVILSCVQAMEKGTGETGRLLQTIKSEGNRMSRLIGDMLSLANADNKSWSVMKTDCELDTLLLETYEKYEPILREKKISLKVVLPEEPLSICKCDSARLSQVLGILLDNGASYVPAGGRMELGVEEKEKYFRIYVQDNGPGIPDENKEAVFQRFYREDSARKDKQHFGLGLCIAKEIVTLHKGSIRITDTPGGGSTFVIKLPKEK